jgi:hypothetical protein
LTRHKNLSIAALVVALLALVASLGGGSYAAALFDGGDIKNHSITGKDIKKSSIKSKHVKDNNLKGKDVKDGSLSAADLAAGTLDANFKTLRVAATSGGSVAAARAAAPENVLFTKAPFTVYAKCFTDTSGGPTTYAETYIKTSVSGALFSSDSDDKDGGALATDLLNTDTPEDQRQLRDTSAGPNDADLYGYDYSDFTAVAADGSFLFGDTVVGAKNGTLAGGNGPWGAGDACLFLGDVRK